MADPATIPTRPSGDGTGARAQARRIRRRSRSSPAPRCSRCRRARHRLGARRRRRPTVAGGDGPAGRARRRRARPRRRRPRSPVRQCRTLLDAPIPLRLWVGGDSLAGSLGPALGTIAGATGVVQPVLRLPRVERPLDARLLRLARARRRARWRASTPRSSCSSSAPTTAGSRGRQGDDLEGASTRAQVDAMMKTAHRRRPHRATGSARRR